MKDNKRGLYSIAAHRFSIWLITMLIAGYAGAVTISDQTVSLPSGEVFYRDSGGVGIPVVFLHAGSGNSMLWEYQIPAFTEAGYRFIAINYRGIGNGNPGGRTDSKALINDLVDYLELPDFHLIGTAAGGGQALEYAMLHQDRLRSISVINSLGNVKDDAYSEMGNRIRPPEFNQLPLQLRELGPSYRAVNPEGEARWLALSNLGKEDGEPMPPPPRSDSAAAQEDPAAVTWDKLEQFRLPTLLMTGDADLYTPPSALRMFKERMPQAEYFIIPESGHSGFWENPEFFNSHVLDFITKH